MRSNWFTRITSAIALGAAATLAVAAPGWAAVAGTPGADPPGANGTVKIDGPQYDEGIANEPHVTCEFAVKFFNFDAGERANIVFTVQPPTGSDTVLLRQDNVVISNDAAGGGKPDPDEVFHFTVSDLGLAAYEPHPKQGYHVKLTVELLAAPGAGKQKVFWVRPCTTKTSPPAGGGGGNGGGLPVTGVAVGTIVLLGLGLVAGGAGLLAVRRRRLTRFTA